MFHVYVLKSERNGKRYIGCTSKLPNERLEEHNKNSNRWTSQNGPFKLIYSEAFQDKKEAFSRERFLKSGQGRKWFQDNGY
jgi:putative endonuclease